MAEDTNISTAQLNTKEEVKNFQAQDNSENKTPTAAQTEEKQQQTAPIYNPLLGWSKAKYAAILSGDDQEHPLYTTDKYGALQFHPENIQKYKGPARIGINQETAEWDVIGRREALQKNVEGVAKELQAYANTLSADLGKSWDATNRAKRLIAGGLSFVAETSRSFDDMFLNDWYAIKAQGRNIAELKWNSYISDLRGTSDGNNTYNEVRNFIKWAEESEAIKVARTQASDLQIDPYSFERRFIFTKKQQDSFGLSDKAKEVLGRYEELLEARDEDERRMMIAKSFEESESAIRGKSVKDISGTTDYDKEDSIAMMVGSWSGQVTGSLAAAWLQSVTATKAIGVASRALRATRGVFGIAEAANLASKGGAVASLAQAASMSEKLIAVPVFLNQYNQIRTEALLSGKTLSEANGIAFLAGAAEAGLEFAGFKFFKRFYTADGIIKNYILRNIFPEAIQEASQTIAENIITEGFGVTDKQWSDIMAEIGLSIVAGGIGGGAFTFARFRTEGMMAYAEKIQSKFIDSVGNIATKDLDVAFDAMIDGMRYEEMSEMGDAVAKKETREKAKEDYAKLTKEQQEAYKAWVELYKGYKNFATERLKQNNPNITQKQLQANWEAIKVMTQMERGNKTISQNFFSGANLMISFLNNQDKLTKTNKRNLVDKLKKSGLSKDRAEAYLSAEDIDKNDKAWDLAEEHIVNQLTGYGASASEAGLLAKFTKGLYRQASLVNPSITPLELVKQMRVNVLDIQKAVFFGKSGQLPEQFRPITYNILQRIAGASQQNGKNVTTIEAKLRSIATALFTDGISDAEVKSINEFLYGNQGKDADPELKRLKAAILTQIPLIKQVIDRMPIKTDLSKLTDIDYAMMYLMTCVYSGPNAWTNIFNYFGIELRDKRFNIDKTFEETRDEVFKESKPLQKDIKALNKLADSMSQQKGYLQEDSDILDSGSSFYNKEQNLIVLNNKQTGTIFHEFGHFTLTRMLALATDLNTKGLLPESSPVASMYKYLYESAKRNGRNLTDRQFQETILDAARQYIARGKTNDPILTKYMAQMKADKYNNTKKLVGSILYADKNAGAREKKKVQQYRENLIKTVGSVFEDAASPLLTITEANKLQQMAMFEGVFTEGSSVQKNKQQFLTKTAQAIEDFLEKHPVRDTDELKHKAQKAFNDGDILKLAHIASTVAEQAVDFATDLIAEDARIFAGTTKAAAIQRSRMIGEYYSPVGSGNEQQVFGEVLTEDDILDNDLKARDDYFRRDNLDWKEMAKEFKSNSWDWTKELFGRLFDTIKNYTLSLQQGAADVHKELENIIMSEMYVFHQRVQKFRETVAPVVNAFDKRNATLSDEQRALEAPEWRLNFHAKLGDGEREAARTFLAEKLGEEVASEWDEALVLLDEIKPMLETAGLSTKIFQSDDLNYFPMVVQDYEGLTKHFFGFSHTYNELEKITARARQEYIEKNKIPFDKQKGNYAITKEQERELEIVLSDLINSQFQRNITDESRLASFYKRTQTDYSKRPDMLRYYYDPFTALDKYMEAAYRTVMMRDLVGRVQVNDETGDIIFEDIDINAYGVAAQKIARQGKIGNFLQKNPLIFQEKADAVKRFHRFMRDFVMRDSSDLNNISNFFRDVNSLTMLTNVFSTINQLQDLEFVFTAYGLKPTMKAIKQVLFDKDSGYTKLEQIGGQPLNELYRTEGQTFTSRLTRKAFKYTGFEWADKKVKEIAINAMYNSFQDIGKAMLKQYASEDEKYKSIVPISGPYAEFDYILDGAFTPPEVERTPNMSDRQYEEALAQRDEAHKQRKIAILKDFAEGKQTEDTKYLQFLMLSKLQPIDSASVPAGYNNAGPLGRLMYQFNTVALKQMEFLKYYYDMKKETQGPIAAAKGMARFVSYALSIGIPKTLLESLLKGERPELSDFILSPAHVFLINSYVISVAKQEGIPAAAMSAFSPKFGGFNNITKDIIRFISGQEYKGFTWKNIPVFGSLFWHWFFGGREANIKRHTALFHTYYDKTTYRDILIDAENALENLEVF